MELVAFFFSVFFQLFLRSLIIPIPVSDTRDVRYKTIPWATAALVFANCMIFVFIIGPDIFSLTRFFNQINRNEITSEGEFYAELQAAFYGNWRSYERNWLYGFRVPNVQGDGLSIGAFTTFTAIFMHADFYHLFFNMLFLWSFGRRIEDACGPWRFLLFYLLAGMVANIGAGILNPSEIRVPGIGASGAISGLMGAYLILFYGARVRCMWGIGMFLRLLGWVGGMVLGMDAEGERTWKWTIELPALLVLGFYAALDVIPSFDVISQGQTGGVSHLAHMTGFLAALLIFLYVRKDLLTRYFAGRSL